MAHKLTIDLADEVYERLVEAGIRIGLTPEEYLVAQVRALTTLRMPAPSEALRKFAGAVSVPNPRGLDNEAIDEDLAQEYGDSHENGD